MKIRSILFTAFAILVLVSVNSCSKSSSTTPTTTTYFPAVKTIISNNCLSCHSSTGTWAGRPTAFDSDSAIAADAAIIKTAIAGPWTFFVKRMPQGGSLSAADSTTIVNWYNKGGKTTD